jgi:hypothetical protein
MSDKHTTVNHVHPEDMLQVTARTWLTGWITRGLVVLVGASSAVDGASNDSGINIPQLSAGIAAVIVAAVWEYLSRRKDKRVVGAGIQVAEQLAATVTMVKNASADETVDLNDPKVVEGLFNDNNPDVAQFAAKVQELQSVKTDKPAQPE